MPFSSRNGGRQTANAANVRSRDPLCLSREKRYAVLNLSIQNRKIDELYEFSNYDSSRFGRSEERKIEEILNAGFRYYLYSNVNTYFKDGEMI